MSIFAMLTEHTCGEACWHARDEVCRCSCGGKNHGCLRGAHGVQPVRACKLDGQRYYLRAVALDYRSRPRPEAYPVAEQMLVAAGFRNFDYNARRAPVRIKGATPAQIEQWPELKSYREALHSIAARPHCQIDLMDARPYLFWVLEGVEFK